MCHRTAESERPEEGIVELVIPQSFKLFGNAPQYSVVFRDDGQRHRVSAVQMIEKLGHEERDVAEFGDKTSLIFLASHEARSLVEDIIDASTSAESRDHHHTKVPSDIGGKEETGGSLVESVLRTVNDMIDKGHVSLEEAAPPNMNGSEDYAEGAYDDRDKSYADGDGEGGHDELVQDIVGQILDQQHTGEEEVQEDVLHMSATQLIGSVLRTIDDDTVENEPSIQSTTSMTAQTLVDTLMDEVWTEDPTTDGGSTGAASNTSDRLNQLVSGIVNETVLDESDASSSSAEASDQPEDFLSDVLNLQDDGNHETNVTQDTHDLLSGILDDMRGAESLTDEGEGTYPPKPPTDL